jgi:enamine deaminase RidA (YjgF/YER057c/UK114 family)
MNNPIEYLDSSKTPKAPPFFSKATKVKLTPERSVIYTSGSLGQDPETGKLVSEDAEEQAVQSLENLKNLLE